MADEALSPESDVDQYTDGALASEPVESLLIEPDQGWIVDDEPAVVASEAVGDVGPLSAEESAIHVISEDEAPGLTWDESAGYLDEEPTGQGSGSAEAGGSPSDP